ncbi:cytochrome C [Aliihoeflea aestuarii]|jgi:cytochrome subunit of sulfide dehydrogenase|uniref:c-type cytochrome n=1 Tax=Aliihoeflea aestuarii TaxID=453840 RepID=UPI002092DF92|nr:c-type cytochrome [Aliihoeflea aestuarii]MCO6390985.1 cytochrome C [Aliihoeflea aestuarii]
MFSKHFRRGVVVAAMLAAFAGPASALSEDEVSVLAGTCANCHGTDGRSPGAIPAIAGQDYDILREQLLAFKAGEVEGATIMTRHATGYTDEELDALARYFSEIEP